MPNRSIFRVLAALIAIFSGITTFAQTTDSVVKRLPPSSYEGRHFFVGFMQNENYIYSSGLHLQIYIASSRPTRVGLTPPGSRIATYFNLSKDTILTLEVPQSEVHNYESFESEIIRYKLAEITADHPVTVYVMSSQTATSDAYSLLPTPEWGRNYVVLSAANDNYTNDPDVDPELREARQSEFLVMAAHDNTLVVINPTATTERGVRRGESMNVTLNKGQCFLVKSSPQLPPGFGDLSGTIVSADKPVGVLSGHVRASIPTAAYDREDNSKDHLCEMLLPVEKWDSEYVSTPFDIFSIEGDYFKITTAEANTEVMYSGLGFSGRIVLANPGDTASLDNVTAPLVWTGTKKFSIAQYMRTSFQRRQEFDPALVVLPPRNRYVSRALFQILPNPGYNPQKFTFHYAGLVADAAAMPNLTLDGIKVTDLNPKFRQQLIPTRNLYWVNLNVTPGVHELRADTGKFSGIIYGSGLNDSYAMTLGISFDRPDADTLPPAVTYVDDCGTLTGEATDRSSPEMTGIFSATVIQNVNFSYVVSPLKDTSRFLTFSAKPVDPTQDGLIVFDVRDKAGNGRIVRHTYRAMKMSVDKAVSFGAVNWLDSVCKSVVILNTGNAPIQLSDVALTGDKRVRFVPDISASLKNRTLAAGDSIVVQICFYPSGDSLPLAANCRVSLPCNLALDIPVTAKVVAPGILAEGWDFGDVLVGDTVCADVRVRNTGNIPMIISNLNLPVNPNFIWKKGANLPDTLAPRDSMLIPVCFAPTERISYKDGGFAVDQFNGRSGFTVTGRGIAPLVVPASLDWGKRRVGTVNDSLFWLKNTGNTKAVVFFAGATGDAPAFATLGSGVQGFEIRENDSIQVAASFVPPANGVQQFSMTETFSVQNWKFHPLVPVTLSGEGTLPDATTFDTDFGTVQMNKTKDSITLCATAGGNENLTVDSMYITGGDVSHFVIPAAELSRRRVVAPGGQISLPATFAPKSVGAKELTLAIVHDAMPNYKRRESLFKLTGNASPDDTVQALFNATVSSAVTACKQEPMTMTLTNTGNRPLTVDSFYVAAPQNVTITSSALPQLPYSLPPGGIVSGEYRYRAKGSDPFDLVFRASATFGSVRLPFEERSRVAPSLQSTTAKITLGDPKPSPGQIMRITLSGTIAAADTTPVLPFVTFEIPAKIAVYQVNQGFCEVRGNDGTYYPALISVSQTESAVTIEFEQQILLTGAAEWKVLLPFMLMLNEQLTAPLALHFADKLGGCFTDATDRATLEVSPVCAQDIRTVKAMSGVYMLLGASPLPAGNTVTVRYLSPEKMDVEFEAVTLLGTRLPLGKATLNELRGEVSVDISALPAGAYRLTGKSAGYGSRDIQLMVAP